MKTGRPKKVENRTVNRTIRFTEEEFSAIQEKADLAGITVSEMIRRSACGAKISHVDISAVSVLRDSRATLTRIGNNINQLAKKCNSANLPAELRANLAEWLTYGEIIEELKAQLLKIMNSME